MVLRRALSFSALVAAVVVMGAVASSTLQWLILDNVSLTRTTMATGTTCREL